MLKNEIEMYQKREKKSNKDEHRILSIKKENRQLQELYAKQELVVEQLLQEKTLLRKEIIALRNKVKEKEEFIAGLEVQKHKESDSEKTFKEEIAAIKQDKIYESERKRQLEVSLHKMKQ